MDNDILSGLNFNPERGGLYFKEVRYLLIRPETLASFQKGIERETGRKASQILYESGFHGGNLSSRKYRETFQLSDEEIIHFMLQMGPQIGWGRFELEIFNRAEKRLAVKVYSSPFAEAYGPSKFPVCHLIRGILSGMASVIFNEEIETKEKCCLAMGNPYCAFEIM